MSDFAGREKWEKRLARQIAGMEQGQQERLIGALGNPPRLENVPWEFWDEVSNEWQALLTPALEGIFLEAAQAMLEESVIGVDWTLVNQAAANWASSYTFDLVKGIVDNTRNALQDIISNFYRNGLTIGDLTDRLAQLFGPVRAELIAATETTRAAVAGEQEIADLIKELGVEMVAVWNTENDEIVCPICGPLNQRKQGDGWVDPPPAHPRCRCWVNHEFAKKAISD